MEVSCMMDIIKTTISMESHDSNGGDENDTLSLLTRKRAVNNPQDSNESEGRPAAKRLHVKELQTANAQLRKETEELQSQLVQRDEVIGKKAKELTRKDEQFASMKTLLQDEVVANVKVIAERDEVIAKKNAKLSSIKAKLKKMVHM